MSLLRNAHRPYCHLDNDEDRFLYRHHRKAQRKKNRLQKWLMLTVAILVIVLVSVVVAAINIYLSSTSDPSSVRSFMEGVSGMQQSSAAFEDALVVRTNCGEYVGTIEDGAFVFKGVPYAKPPVGHLRWKKPVPAWIDRNWCSEKPRQRAHKYSVPCFQLSPATKKYSGKEDCLYLNVWTPRLDASAGLEVMVWIHGGFFQFGSGHDVGLCPSGKVAKDMNMVFVSFNFRLYALGFMAMDLLLENPGIDAQGNYGIWDQIVALQWVQENIRAFGGDPEKVTIFGADSGAASILALMSSGSAAKGLFQSAWLMGPTMTFNRTFEDLSQHNQALFLPRSGCNTTTCVRKISAMEVIQTYLWKDEPSFRIRDQNDLPIQGIFPEQILILDDELLKVTPLEAIKRNMSMDIPLLIGTGAQAINLWPGPEDLPSWDWNHLRKYVVTSLDSFGPGISSLALQEYNSSEFNDFATPEEVYCTMVSDLRQTCGINDLCQTISEHSEAPVYRYIVTSKPSQQVRVFDYPASYSFHTWEAIAFFDHMEYYIDHPTEEDFSFKSHIQKVVGSFVRSRGKRISEEQWTPFPETVAVISHNITVTPSYHSSKCQFWHDQGFVNYAWVS